MTDKTPAQEAFEDFQYVFKYPFKDAADKARRWIEKWDATIPRALKLLALVEKEDYVLCEMTYSPHAVEKAVPTGYEPVDLRELMDE